MSTGRAAISMPSMLFYLPTSFVFALEREFALVPGDISSIIRIVLAGELTSCLFLHICSLTLLRNRKTKEQSLVLCLLVWAFTGVIRGFFAEYYATTILNYDSFAIMRILASVIFSTLGLALAAYIFGTIFELETKKAALRSLNGFISSETSKLNSEQIAMKEEAITTLQQTLIPRVIQLQRLTSGLKKFELSQSLSLALISLEEQAHLLAYQMRVNLDKLESIPNPRLGSTSRIFNPRNFTLKIVPTMFSFKLSFLLLFIGGVVVQYSRNSTSGAFISMLSSVLLGIILFVFDQLSKIVAASYRRYVYICGYISIFVIHFIYTSKIAPLILELSEPFNPWYSAAKVTFAVYLASSFLSFLEEDKKLLKSMGNESTSSRENLDIKSGKNELLEAVNTTTNQGELQGHISGVILALNLLAKDENSQIFRTNLAATIENANTMLSNAITEIQNLSVKELLN